MYKPYRHTIKREFFVTSFLSALIISVLFIVLIAISTYYFSMENAEQSLQTANLHLTTYTEGVMESLVIAVKTNAQFPGTMYYPTSDLRVKQEVLNLFKATKAANPNLKYAYAGYEDGTLAIEDYIPPVGFDPRERPWYRWAVENYPQLSIGLPYQDAVSNEWLVSVSMAMFDEDQVLLGVMAVDCSLGYIKELMSDVNYYDSQINYVLGRDWDVYVHDNDEYLFQHVDDHVPGLSSLFTETEGFVRYKAFDVRRVAYYNKIESIGWVVVSAIDADEITRPVVARVAVVLAALIPLAVILGIAQVMLYEKRFVKPITSLKERIGEIVDEKPVSNPSLQYSYSNGELANIAKDIEELAETSLRKKANELRLILDSTSDGILVLNMDGKAIHVNNRYKEYWHGLLSKIYDEEKYNKELMKQEDSLKLLRLDGDLILEECSFPLVDRGELKGKLWRYRDVTEQVNAEENLKLQATTDSLTGLWNRRYFMERGDFEVNIVRRTGLPLSLLFIDLDFFKIINDTYGHGVGDKTLKRTASVLKSHVRATDIVSRLGGEEFCILAPNTSLEAAGVLAEKLRSYFESSSFEIDGETIKFTISVGVSTYVAGDESVEVLLAHADKACYQAKDQGRNCVVSYRV